jgi:hypothetical protein
MRGFNFVSFLAGVLRFDPGNACFSSSAQAVKRPAPGLDPAQFLHGLVEENLDFSTFWNLPA